MIFSEISKTFKNSKKKIPHFKNKKNMFCFHVYGQILKVFHAYFLTKKYIFIMSEKYKNEYCNQFVIFH
jgi:hypothetical protein